METPFLWTLNDLQIFLLVFFRIAGMVMMAPLFGGDTVPLRLRAMIALVMAVLVFPLVDRTGVVVVPNIAFYITN